MNAKRLIPISAATVACALGAVPAWTSAASAADIQQATSANWSGYAIGGSSGSSSSDSGQRFSSVTGSWVQPTAKCTGQSTYSAFWVGLGGSGGSSSADASGFGDSGSGAGLGQSSSDGSGTSQADSLEQAGTEADCSSGGSASYFAWYELVPAAPVKLGLAVNAGDHMTTKVAINGSNMVVTMSDQTTGQSTSKTVPTNNPDTSSAEWVAEAPSQCDGSGGCNPLPLTDFGNVSFTGASATQTDGHTGTISDPNWSAAAIQLNPDASSSGFGGAQFASTGTSGAATPSSLSSNGSSFSVAWSSSSGQTSTAGGGGAGSGSGSGDPYGYGGGSGYGSGSGDPYGYGGGSGYGYGSGGWGIGDGGQVYVY
ncbi:MAG TPA: G1 family glutamic endopeptidase [Solirubrobacteraceae bacterium]